MVIDPIPIASSCVELSPPTPPGPEDNHQCWAQGLAELNDLLSQLITLRSQGPASEAEAERRHQLGKALDVLFSGSTCAWDDDSSGERCECEGAVERCNETLYLRAIQLSTSLAGHCPPTLIRPSPSPSPSPFPEEEREITSHSLTTTARLRNLLLPSPARLPPDLLSYIFSLPSSPPSLSHFPDPSSINSNPTPSPATTFAHRVAQVSHLWRTLALSTPACWSLISLGHSPLAAPLACSALSRCDCPPRRALLDRRSALPLRAIERAKAVPVGLDVGPYGRVEVGAVVQALLESQEQGRTPLSVLSWSLPVGSLLLTLGARCRETLRELRLIRPEGQRAQTAAEAAGVEELLGMNLERLERLELVNLPLPSRASALQECQQLKVVLGRESQCTLGRILGLLEGCRRLERLEVGRIGDVDIWEDGLAHPSRSAWDAAGRAADSGPQALLMPKLKSLILDEGTFTEDKGLLAHLTCPELRKLRLASPWGKNPPTSVHKLVAVLCRFLSSAMKVEYLELPYRKPQTWLGLFPHLPALKVLGLQGDLGSVGAFFGEEMRTHQLGRCIGGLEELRVWVGYECEKTVEEEVGSFVDKLGGWVGSARQEQPRARAEEGGCACLAEAGKGELGEQASGVRRVRVTVEEEGGEWVRLLRSGMGRVGCAVWVNGVMVPREEGAV